MAAELTRLAAALSELDGTSKYMTLPVARAFLSIALREGERQMDHSERLGIKHKGLMSRALAHLGEGQKGMGGIGLIRTKPDPDDPRAKRYFLTDAGERLAQTLGNLIRDSAVR